MAPLPAFSADVSVDPAALQGVWTADALAAASTGVVGTGHARLDAELPGGGWPLGALIEVLQPAADGAVWSLLLPALAQRAQAGRVALVNPPHEPYVPALAAAGVPPRQLLWLRPPTPPAQAWASEQALRCQDVAATLAWLPGVHVADLRRLQQAAAQTGSLLFVLRPERRAALAASPARVRLRVAAAWPAAGAAAGLRLIGTDAKEDAAPSDEATLDGPVPRLRVDLLKRRGPPRAQPLWLPACGSSVQNATRAVWAQAQDRVKLEATQPAVVAPAAALQDRREHRDTFAAQAARHLAQRSHGPRHALHGIREEGGHALAGASLAA